MDGKICVLTGASSGIGKAAAQALARRGASLVLICRNRRKAEDTASEIRETTRSPALDLLIADLSSQQQIRIAAAQLLRKYRKLHVLINNAGAMFATRTESVDRIEMTLAVNHLAPFLLTNLLLERLKESGEARIINVNSDAHEQGKIDFDNLEMRRDYGRGVGMRAYANAKLANLLTVYELARRLRGTRVTVNALHPGYVATNIVPLEAATGLWRIAKPFWGLAARFILTPEEGARAVVHLAGSPQLAHESGRYFEKCVAVASSPTSYDTVLQRRMWDVSEALTVETP